MKKLTILLALILTAAIIPTAYAGKNNTVSPEWYYNDPDGSAYLDGTRGSGVIVPSDDPYWQDFYDYDYTYLDYTDYYYTVISPTSTPVQRSIRGLGYRTLKRTYPCMRGSDVRNLQILLNALGYSCGRADGIFGDKTKAAVRAFQRRNGLVVDGIVGPATRKKLMNKYRTLY